MDSKISYFLPSLIRGVYRYDERYYEIDGVEDFRSFVEKKLLFLPEEQFQVVFKKYIDPDLSKFFSDSFNNHRYQTNNQKYQTYCRHFPHFESDVKVSELEKKFVQKILSSFLSIEGLIKIQPQTPISKFYADFTVEGEKRYVFEIDGFGKFENRDDLDKFLYRQNVLVNQGWQVYRFSYIHIEKNTQQTIEILKRIFLDDSQLKRFVINSQQNNPDLNLSTKSNALNPIEFVNNYYLIQDYLVYTLLNKPELRNGPIIINDRFGYPFPFVALSLSHLFHQLYHIETLFQGLNSDLPDIQVYCKSADSQYNRLISDNVRVISEPQQTYFIEIDQSILQGLNYYYPFFSPPIESVSFRQMLTVEKIKHQLKFITQEIFRYPKGTHSFQDRVLNHIFNNNDVLGIFPTGAGKSFCFWFPALYKPGLTLVISPLRSLMRDQKLTLENCGIASVEFINSDVKREEQERILLDVKMGRIKLLYIAPERMRIKRFLDDLLKLKEFIHINYLVIDEAHCISEWGHDFRPSYLTIPQFLKQLKAFTPDAQLLAFTATAGQVARRDIVNILNFRDEEGGNVISARNFDRKRFSYQIIGVNDYQQKQKIYETILKEYIPRSLRYYMGNHEALDLDTVLNCTNRNGEKAAGIVYTIYANPHGRTFIYDGIAHYLLETKRILEPDVVERFRVTQPNKKYNLDYYGTGRARAFSSKEPEHCPNCYSYQYSKVNNRNQCFECGYRFDNNETKKPKAYNKITRKNQEDFKRGELDVLVATKGFGMGIDKGSVRFIVHTALASSTEAWYQEIGRAGRDEERAHCVSLVDLPNESCLKELQTGHQKAPIPRCNYMSGCVHGKSSLCDYGKQHMFIKNSYPGVVNDVYSILKILNQILELAEHDFTNIVKFPVRKDFQNEELALIRLQKLGIIVGFSVIYQSNVFIEVCLNLIVDSQGVLNFQVNAESLLQALKNYIESNKLNPKSHKNQQTIESRMTECRKIYFNELGQKFTDAEKTKINKYLPLENVVACLLTIVDHIYSDVVRMRYDMLYNLCSDIFLNDHQCRRVPILEYFETPSEPDYHCELCDNCVPDLNFIKDERETVIAAQELEEFQKKLEEAFVAGEFYYEHFQELKEKLKDYPSFVFRRSRAILEGSPDNLAALYFAREFAPEDMKEAQSLRLMRTGNRYLDMELLKLLYETTEEVYKKSVLFVLDDQFGNFNNPDGWHWLYEQAIQLQKHQFDQKLYEMKEKLGLIFIENEFERGFNQKVSEIKDRLQNEQIVVGG